MCAADGFDCRDPASGVELMCNVPAEAVVAKGAPALYRLRAPSGVYVPEGRIIEFSFAGSLGHPEYEIFADRNLTEVRIEALRVLKMRWET